MSKDKTNNLTKNNKDKKDIKDNKNVKDIKDVSTVKDSSENTEIKDNNAVKDDKAIKDVKEIKEDININDKNIDEDNKKNNYKRRMNIVIIAIVVFAIISYIVFRGSYLELKEIGTEYVSIFWKNIKYTILTFAINFAFIYTIVYLTNRSIKKGLKDFFVQENKTMPKFLNKSIAFISALIISASTSGMILEKAMLCFNRSEFGIYDPNFGIDLGYYIFQQPFLEMILWYFIVLAVVLLIYKVVYYIATFNKFFDGVDKKLVKNSRLIKQIITSVLVLTFLLSAFIVLEAQNIGNSTFVSLNNDSAKYSLYGAGFVDVNVKVWGYRIFAIVIIISVLKAINRFKNDKTKQMLGWILVIPLYLVLLFVVMAGAQGIFVDNNEYDKEKSYISSNIKATKQAYGIDIEETSLDEAEEITSRDVTLKYADTLNNIVIVDQNVVLKDLNSGQTAKGYYSYKTTQIGKYNIDGEDSLVYISPREIVNGTGTYNSKTFENTHGYGIIVSSATNTTENGNVLNMQKEFETENENVIQINEPRIYYGLETNETVVTNCSSNKEFDYPVLDSSNAENIQNEYNGKSGLSLGLIDRIILSIKEGNIKLAFSDNITSQSKILINRNIIKRAKTVMPYLKYDEEPYMVISDDGNLIWVLDAYTISNQYPYSQKISLQETQTSKTQLNYIRNSVKVLIDSYNGTMKFYITDRTDPIVMAYYNIYPDLFENIDEKIPSDISKNFVYPKYLYNIQASIITRYHNIQPDVLYRGDDIWSIATHNTGKVLTKNGTQMEPYYTTINTVDSQTEELGLILPYTIYGKQNLIAYIVGKYDSEGNQNLKIYKYSANSNVLGPMQLDSKIEEDEIIKKEIEALNVTGTKITKNMIVVPLNNTMLYVEPIFTQYINEKTSLPSLKKVIVASGTKVAIGDNLKEALTNLVSRYAVNIEIESTDTIEDLIDAIIKANNNLTTSNASNDWEMIGKDVKKLQELIDKLEVLVEEDKQNKLKEEEELSANQINANMQKVIENIV